MTEPKTRCAFSKCQCEFDAEHAIARDGEAFCSERCADGRGCSHQGCNCGQFPAEKELRP